MSSLGQGLCFVNGTPSDPNYLSLVVRDQFVFHDIEGVADVHIMCFTVVEKIR